MSESSSTLVLPKTKLTNPNIYTKVAIKYESIILFGEIFYVMDEFKRYKGKHPQQQLADAVGVKRSFIARIEKGETDMQMSSFLRIANALDIQFTPVYK
jgi:DNA-binding XRE family transcriptional regulator